MVRRLPREFGRARIVVSPECGLRYLHPNFERIDGMLLRLARQLVLPGDVVWDVGANVGLFSVAATVQAGSGGEVVAFEADRWLVSLLERTVRLRDGARQAPLTVMARAVSDGAGTAQFHIANRARAASHLSGYGTSQAGGVRLTVEVPTVSLDGMLEERRAPTVVKIDVEGAEPLVFRGATRLLATARPALIVEVYPRSEPEVRSCLQGNEYVIFDAENPCWFVAAETVCGSNIVALPREREAAIREHARLMR